ACALISLQALKRQLNIANPLNAAAFDELIQAFKKKQSFFSKRTAKIGTILTRTNTLRFFFV
ncbi:MAG TPA: hypothetical protein PLH09_03855, partial [Lentimicrobium sp.]|nr:hypothetical protein [Lentimicrobium sp.]